MKITVIGETNIDIIVKAQGPLVEGGCTPSKMSFRFGGVARNIAENLFRMGHQVQLMTLFGDDDYAARLKRDCKDKGISLSLSDTKNGFHSPFFLSHTDNSGNIRSAFSDMDINMLMDKNWIEQKMDLINQSDLIVADTLLQAKALAHLIRHSKVPVFIDTVSPNKAMRMSEAMKEAGRGFFALKCNQQEALALTNLNDAETSAMMLAQKGIQHVYVTMGADGVYYSNGKDSIHVPALEVHIVDVMGSGDAFLAGIVDAFSKGQKGEAALPYGLAASKKAIESATE